MTRHHQYSLDLRPYNWGGVVKVFLLQLDGTEVFDHYETSKGEPCDENGVKLGEVKFKIKGRLV